METMQEANPQNLVLVSTLQIAQQGSVTTTDGKRLKELNTGGGHKKIITHTEDNVVVTKRNKNRSLKKSDDRSQNDISNHNEDTFSIYCHLFKACT